MKEKIYLKWAKSLQKESFNFGDDLNPYIIEKLSGQKVQYVHFANTRLNIVKQFIKEGSKNGFTNDYVSNFFKSMFAKKYVIAIGSILQWYSSSRSIVWGAGIIERNSTVQNSDFRAVRGKYTAKRLIELGYRVPDIYGDPALLLPLVYTPKVSKSYKLGIIPHISHYSLVQQVFSHEDILVIDLNTDNIEAVVDQICSCNYIASTSLHGLIVSHAYGISAVWFEVKNAPLAGDNIKFFDYFSSVGIPEYLPFTLALDSKPVSDELISIIESEHRVSNVKVNLSELRSKLLKAAPFNLRSEFIKW